MPTERGKRIEGSCKIIWGAEDYDLDCESEDGMYQCSVKIDLGTSYGPELAVTGICYSKEHA
jgi:hypothetical protein